MCSTATLEQPPAITRRTTWMMPLAAGIFVGALIFDALPAALGSVGGWTWILAGTGLAIMAYSSRLAAGRRLGWAAGVATAGVWFHSILEGVASGAGSGLGVAGAILLGTGLVMHLIPESAALYAVSTEAGVSSRRAMLRCAFTWVLVLAGFLTGQLLLDEVPSRPLGAAMGLAAGVFAYLAWVLWQQRRRDTGTAWLGVVAGVAWIAATHL